MSLEIKITSGKSGATEVKGLTLLSINIERAINQIPKATIVCNDGSLYTRDFAKSL